MISEFGLCGLLKGLHVGEHLGEELLILPHVNQVLSLVVNDLMVSFRVTALIHHHLAVHKGLVVSLLQVPQARHLVVVQVVTSDGLVVEDLGDKAVMQSLFSGHFFVEKKDGTIKGRQCGNG